MWHDLITSVYWEYVIATWWLFLLVAVLSSLCAYFVLHYALRSGLIDIPNERSSHCKPVPRGGGLSIGLVIVVTILYLFFSGRLPGDITIAWLPAIFVVGMLGWLDDHYHLPVTLRAAGYLVTAIWFVLCLEYTVASTMAIPVAGTLSWFATMLIIIAVAWVTNLYNFMDGIDGLAATQAILAGVAGSLILWHVGTESLSLISATIAAATAGFLLWNWPPAKIFMGDVGSCTLGFMFATLAILGQSMAGLSVLIWVILLAWFIWDATLTLTMRIMRGEKWFLPHRSHAYQCLVRAGFSHVSIVWMLIGYNTLVLWPLAWWAYIQPQYLYTATVISVLSVGMIWGAVQIYTAMTINRDTGIAGN